MDTNQIKHPEGCKCDNCDGGIWSVQHHHHHWILRLLALVLIVLFTFWLGFQLGSMKGFIEANGGYGAHRMMQDYGGARAGNAQTFVLPTNQ
jgi:hypothetical protein